MIFEGGLKLELAENKAEFSSYFGGDLLAPLMQYEVQLKFSNTSSCYVTSGIILRHVPTKKERLVWHLQYTEWPDHGCPENPLGFLGN